MPRSAPLFTEMTPGTVARSKPYQAATAYPSAAAASKTASSSARCAPA